MTQKRVVVVPNPDALAESVSQRLLGKIAVAVSEDRPVHVALTGGRMGIAVLEAAGRNPMRELIDWSRVHLWWSDERFVDRDDPERNELQARAAFIDHIAIPEEQVHPMAADGDGVSLDEAAAAYAAELARFGDAEHPAFPTFAVTLLGVGPDGHIASLFPDRDEIHDTDHTVLAVRDSPKPPPLRLTLTRPVLNASDRVWLLVAGAEKAGALGLILAGASFASVPAAGAKGTVRTVIIVDESAAGQVPEELIERDF